MGRKKGSKNRTTKANITSIVKKQDETVVCSFCKIQKPIDNFYPAKKRKNGIQNYCKECTFIHNSLSRYKNGVIREGELLKEALKRKGIYITNVQQVIGRISSLVEKKFPEMKKEVQDFIIRNNRINELCLKYEIWLETNPSIEEIKKSMKKWLSKCHPDQGGDKDIFIETDKDFKKILKYLEEKTHGE